jgi:hypothetical protein
LKISKTALDFRFQRQKLETKKEKKVQNLKILFIAKTKNLIAKTKNSIEKSESN